MHNVIILGCGRSGTSMVAGCLGKAGYNMGNNYPPPGESNPRGFFEDKIVGDINEEILFKTYPKKFPFSGEWIFEKCTNRGRWLARVPLHARLFSSERIKERIRDLTSKEPFCYKAPLFSYTLPIWRPFLRNSVFICVFRDPLSTARSLIRMGYLENAPTDINMTLEIWKLMYSHILEIHIKKGRWLFLHYDQVFTKKTLGKLEEFTGARVDYSFPSKELRKKYPKVVLPPEINEIYKRLCELAGHKE